MQDDFLLHVKVLNNKNSIKIAVLPLFMHNRLMSTILRGGGKLYIEESWCPLKNKLVFESHKEVLQRLFTIFTM